jgi:excisionase family DNA binding protein
MATPARTLEEVIAEAVREVVRAEVAPLRAELERLRGSNDGVVLVPFDEAARRLGLSLRSIQQRAKDGRIEVVQVGGERLCRLPAGLAPR